MTFTPKFPQFLHGGDYNPDQWLKYPEILEQDVALMQKAHVNCVSVGIFAWAALEPEEGHYDFAWLDQVIDRLWKGGIHVDLATPSGARPAWMAQKYPEVLRVDNQLRRQHFGGRHNHCPSSPVYRKKVQAIDRALAERYANHPAVVLWHLSNEYSGECYCPLCQQRFRAWLKDRYGSLENLNDSWWTSFWSMRYTDWSQVEAPSPIGQMASPAQRVDWRRFATFMCKEFITMERDTVKAVNPGLCCTANLMERFWDYDYFDLAEAIDVVSWDSYPAWHTGDDVALAAEFAMNHDLMRSFKDQPFLLMESTPSLVNWKPVNKVKKPGVHLLSSMQALAHGSQSVMYFQWRKGRGGIEMFHGAVVDHDGRDDTRVFKEVTQVGEALEKLAPLYEKPKAPAEVCILYDTQNRWALDFAQAAQRENMKYFDTVAMHYRSLWQLGCNVDFRDMRPCTDLSRYRLVIAPMLFMFREDMGRRLREYVRQGGTLLVTYFSGVVDAAGLAFLKGAPHDLTDVLGVQAEELDCLTEQQRNQMVYPDGGSDELTEMCELVMLTDEEQVEVLARYGSDFYAGRPCLTRHRFGEGTALYLAAKPAQAGLDRIYGNLCSRLGLKQALPGTLPEGVVATERGGAVFLQNYTDQPASVPLDGAYTDMLSGNVCRGTAELAPYGIQVLTK